MQQEFDVEDGLLYLAGANQSLTPRAVTRARAHYQIAYEKNPTQGLHDVWGQLWAVQCELAAFLHAEPTEIFLRPNATAVLNALILGIPLPPDSEILVGELEYGAVVNICRLRVARDGARLRSLKMPATAPALRALDEAALVDLVVSQLTPNTRVIVLSHVLGSSGLVLPIRAIARETRRRGVLFVVDGTHALGAWPVDFRALADVDFYGVGLYKWMLGPKGTAFGWVAPRHHAFLQPTQGGWTTFESFEPMHGFGGGSRFQEAFLMHGCHDFTPFLAVRDLLAFWRRHGAENIFARRAALLSQLERAMEGAPGWRLLRTPGLIDRGPMLVYDLPQALQAEGPRLAVRLFAEARLQVTSLNVRGRWHLSLGPHIYNSDEDIRRTARLLALR